MRHLYDTCKRRLGIIEALSCLSLPQSANLASTTLVPLVSTFRRMLFGLMSSYTIGIQLNQICRMKADHVPVCAIHFACGDSKADRMLRGMNLKSCLEILASLEDLKASDSRCSSTRRGVSLPQLMSCLINASPANSCKTSFSRCRRVSGAHLSTTCFWAVVLYAFSEHRSLLLGWG
jgi:hypothetical protein